VDSPYRILERMDGVERQVAGLSVKSDQATALASAAMDRAATAEAAAGLPRKADRWRKPRPEARQQADSARQRP
jgi:hypothetical protein